MRFRWKLLVLFLCVSIAPVVLLRTFGIYNVRRSAEALVLQVRENEAERNAHRLREAVRQVGPALDRIAAQLEMALVFQAKSAREAAASHGPPPGGDGPWTRRPGPDGRWLLAVGDGHLAVAPAAAGSGPPAVGAAALASLEDTYRVISDHLGSLVLRHLTRLPSGVVSCYPCAGAEDIGLRPEAAVWYRTAFREKVSFWSQPYTDPATGRSVAALTFPIGPDDGTPVGATSLVVSLDELLHAVAAESRLPGLVTAFVGTLAIHPETREAGVRVMSRIGRGALRVDRHGFLDRSTWAEPGAYREVLEDFVRQRSAVKTLPAEAGNAVWVYTPVAHQGAGLVVVMPAASEEPAAETVVAAIGERTRKVERYTAAFLGILALAGAAAALMFSRAITRPLEAITRAAHALAQGDLKARTAVRRRDEIGVLAASIDEIGPRLEQAYRTRRSIEIASEVQRRLLPEPPDIADFDLFGLTLYSEMAGGDYFDYLCQQPERKRLCVAIGDVSGHGLASALMMASVRSAIRMRSLAPGSVGDIVSEVNDVFADDVGQSGNFMTLFLARLDADAGRLEWVRAGHDPGILYDPRKNAVRLLEGRGIPIGVDRGVAFEAQAVSFRRGEILFLGTDGIWETRNDRGAVFGKDRVYGLIRENAAGSARDIALAVVDAVGAFRGSEAEDDLTCLVVKVR